MLESLENAHVSSPGQAPERWSVTEPGMPKSRRRVRALQERPSGSASSRLRGTKRCPHRGFRAAGKEEQPGFAGDEIKPQVTESEEKATRITVLFLALSQSPTHYVRPTGESAYHMPGCKAGALYSPDTFYAQSNATKSHCPFIPNL